jgi:hypothetical protein
LLAAPAFLDKDHLRALTAARGLDAQEAFLKAEGIPYQRRGSNMVVMWQHVRGWIEGKPLVSSTGPNWSALNA